MTFGIVPSWQGAFLTVYKIESLHNIFSSFLLASLSALIFGACNLDKGYQEIEKYPGVSKFFLRPKVLGVPPPQPPICYARYGHFSLYNQAYFRTALVPIIDASSHG